MEKRSGKFTCHKAGRKYRKIDERQKIQGIGKK